MNIRRNKSGVVIVHEGSYVLKLTDRTAICRGENTEAITTAAGQEVFAAALGAVAIAEAPNSRSYATVEGSTCRAVGQGTLAVAMANGSKAYARRKGAHAIATVVGAQSFLDDPSATCSEDFIQRVYVNHNTKLRLTIM